MKAMKQATSQKKEREEKRVMQKTSHQKTAKNSMGSKKNGL